MIRRMDEALQLMTYQYYISIFSPGPRWLLGNENIVSVYDSRCVYVRSESAPVVLTSPCT